MLLTCTAAIARHIGDDDDADDAVDANDAVNKLCNIETSMK